VTFRKPAERNNWRWIGDREGIHWPDLDEDISVENLILGQPRRKPGFVSISLQEVCEEMVTIHRYRERLWRAWLVEALKTFAVAGYKRPSRG